jgi:outer membrane murein-binding lipoprotein Lpp
MTKFRVTWSDPDLSNSLEGTAMKNLSGYKAFFIVLVPLVFLLILSCSSTQKKHELTDETVADWNATVDKAISEPQRAARLKELGQQMIDVANSIQQDVNALNQKIMLLNEDYTATHEELQQMVEEFSEQRNPKFDEYRDIIFAMRSEVSPEEWKALTK